MILKDYSKICDEVTVLNNPHKGFYYHYMDNGNQRPTYRNGIKSRNEILNFPGMNHLYLRFDWSDVEVEKGVYDWSCIDDIMLEWPEMKFSFRLCTYETGPYNERSAIPQWLAETEGVCNRFVSYFKMIDGTWKWLGDAQGDGFFQPVEGDKSVERVFMEPYYDNEVYLDGLDKMMKEFGRKFNGDSRVECVDVGTFGRWGEGHSQTTPYAYEVLKTHIDLHLKYFPDTQIIINDDLITHLADENIKEAERLREYCYYHNIGMRDDGICVERFCPKNVLSTMREPEMLKEFSKMAPIDIELDHYHQISDEFMAGGLRYLQSLIDSGATYTGFHGYTEPWLEKYRAITEYIANRLGYWYFIDGAEFMGAMAGVKSLIKLQISNKGFARAYHRYDLKITARKGDEIYLLNLESPDNRNWIAGESTTETIILDFKNVPIGEYDLAVGLYEGETPIKLAILNELLNEDGSYTIDKIVVE